MPGPALWEVGGPFPGTGPPGEALSRTLQVLGGCPHCSSSSLGPAPSLMLFAFFSSSIS